MKSPLSRDCGAPRSTTRHGLAGRVRRGALLLVGLLCCTPDEAPAREPQSRPPTQLVQAGRRHPTRVRHHRKRRRHRGRQHGRSAMLPLRQRWLPVGWPDASPDGWNAGETLVSGIRRIPLDGLRSINQANDQQPRMERAGGRAIVLVPKDLDPSQPVDVLVHLHGYNTGYRQEYGATKSNPVRDKDIEHIEEQMQDSKQRQLLVVLPQGVGPSNFSPVAGGDYKGFDCQALLDEVEERLVGVGVLRGAPPAIRLNLSAHSGGGDALGQVLVEAKAHADDLGMVALFDAVNGPRDELPRIEQWLEQRLAEDLDSLRGQDEAAQRRYLETSVRFRAYHTPGGYYGPLHDEARPAESSAGPVGISGGTGSGGTGSSGTGSSSGISGGKPRPLRQFLDEWFAAKEAALGGPDNGAYRGLREHYQVIEVPTATHEAMLGAGLLKEALQGLPRFPVFPDDDTDD